MYLHAIVVEDVLESCMWMIVVIWAYCLLFEIMRLCLFSEACVL